MPSRSRAQHRFMEAAAHDPKFAERAGVSRDVANEFAHADGADDQWKHREHVAKKAAEQGMSLEIYKALYGDK
jgi:hypothetical protein